MLPLLHLGLLFLFLSLQSNAEASLRKVNIKRRTQSNDSFWNYTDVQYGQNDTSLQLMNIALPREGESYGVVMFHHSLGSTYKSFNSKEVKGAIDSGYALVSWEGTGGGDFVDIELAWSYAQTCFDFIRASATQYGWNASKVIISGRSLGSLVSWKLAHSQDPAIVGIYMYNALPERTWQATDLWYPPDDVISPAPPAYMVYGPGPQSTDDHNPTYAYPVRDKYIELGEDLTFIEGMWDDPDLYRCCGESKNGTWINEYGTYHYFPDLAAKIDDVSPPITTHPYEPFTQGANGLYIGHSFFIPMAKKFNDFVNQTRANSNLFSQHGFQTEFSGGQSGTPGNLWLDDDHRNAINASLSTGTIELFGMTNFVPDDDEDIDIQAAYENFLETGVYPSAEENIPEYTQWIDLALSYNPDTAIYVGNPWFTNNNLYTAQEFTDYTEFVCGILFHSIVLELRQLYPGTQILNICYGPVAPLMRQMFEDGNLPDITELVGSGPTALFTDAELGHAGSMMKDMMSLTWLQILYDPPAVLLQRYINEVTPWDKASVRTILTEVLAFNEDYNIKVAQQQSASFWS